MMLRVQVTFISGLLTVMCVLVDCGCVFEDKVYQVGDIWHPGSFGTCVNCTCIIDDQGKSSVKCANTAEKCPRLNCATPKRDHTSCCPYCEDIPNLPPTVSADEDESSSNAKASCTSPSGKVFKDGANFASNQTGIRPTRANQCVMCNCRDGKSLCYLKTCPARKTCSAYIETDDDCCPVCADCQDTTGTINKNGTSWHPTIASIGEITCITCTCHNGNFTCKKNCIPDHELPCRHPHTPNGECCRSCPDTSDGSTIGQSEKNKKTQRDNKERKKNKKKDRKAKCKGKNKSKCKKGDKKRRKCDKKNKNSKQCKRRRSKQAEAAGQSIRPAPAAVLDLNTLCIRQKRTTYLVYKVISDTELMIAFDDIKAGTVDVYKWSVSKDNGRQLVSYMEPVTQPAEEFRRKMNNTNVVGTTGSSQYRKFKSRLKDKLEKCSTDCEPQLFIKIQQRVKVKVLKFGTKC